MKLIAYFRVPTGRQGGGGIGLDAQRRAAAVYAQAIGARIDAAYTEIESGARTDRAELTKAIAHARRIKATLVIAKLDGLARNVAFTSALMESGVEFAGCDSPHANRHTVHILAALAENEARRKSERTKTALAAAKARGQLLGSARPGHWRGRQEARLNGLAKGRLQSAHVRSVMAREAIADLLPEIRRRRQAGATLAAIAEALNIAGHQTVRGNKWSAMQVKRALDRASSK